MGVIKAPESRHQKWPSSRETDLNWSNSQNIVVLKSPVSQKGEPRQIARFANAGRENISGEIAILLRFV